MQVPLAERMRPNTLDDYIGQKHLVGMDGVLRGMIDSGSIASMIFWGPPGTGKTTLANIISKQLKRPFIHLSAINAGVKDIRDAIDKAKKQHFLIARTRSYSLMRSTGSTKLNRMHCLEVLRKVY